ncbi:MAG: YraN family protein [Pseudomonadota bacterium]
MAALFYLVRGYRIVAWRYRRKVGEIDLVARRGLTLAFVEVKARGDIDAAIEAVSPKSRRRFEAAARRFLAEAEAKGALDPAAFAIRYDIFAVAGLRTERIKDAWREGE